MLFIVILFSNFDRIYLYLSNVDIIYMMSVFYFKNLN